MKTKISGIWSCEMESYALGPTRGFSVKSNLTINFEPATNATFAPATTLGKGLIISETLLNSSDDA
jgi:hypothetical protein